MSLKSLIAYTRWALLMPLIVPLIIVQSACLSVSEEDISEEYYNLGNVYYDLGEFDKATELYRKALTINPNFYSVEYNLAFAYMRVERYQDALRFLRQLRESDPDNVLVQESIGYVLFQEGDVDGALQTYNEVLTQDPARVRVLNNLALIQRARGEREESLALYRRAYRVVPENSEVAYGYMILLREIEEIAQREASSDLADATSDLADATSDLADATSDTIDATSDIDDFIPIQGDVVDDATPDSTDATGDSAEIALDTSEARQEKIVQLARQLGADQNLTSGRRMVVGEVLEEYRFFNDALTLYETIDDQEDRYYGEALFRQARILLTAAGEPESGLELLDSALEGGYTDPVSLLQLYDHEFLLQTEEVEEIYTSYEIDVEEFRERAREIERQRALAAATLGTDTAFAFNTDATTDATDDIGRSTSTESTAEDQPTENESAPSEGEDITPPVPGERL